MSLITVNKFFYHQMFEKGRLLPIIIDGRFLGFITFYICDDEKKYAESDPWDVLDDDSNGKICYISQLLTDKDKRNPRIFFSYWSSFKKYIKLNFPLVKIVSWRRWDKKKMILKSHRKEI